MRTKAAMSTVLISALLSPLPRVLGPLPVCVTTDPVVVLGQPVLPSQTVCVPPQ